MKLKSSELRNITLALIGAATILFGFSYYLHQRTETNSPSKLFWKAVEKSLSTSGYVRTIEYSDAENGKLFQETSLSFDSEPTSRIYTSTSGSDGGEVITETIGAAKQDFLRYVKFPGAGEIEGKWSKLPLASDANGRFLVEAITQSLVLSGKLGGSDLDDMLKTLKDTEVYKPVDSETGVEIEGKKTTVISVQIDTGSFTAAQAKLLKLLGLSYAADNLDDGGQSGKVQVEFAIDPSSRRFVAAGMPTIASQSSEKFKDWNQVDRIKVPEQQIEYKQIQDILTEANNASSN